MISPRPVLITTAQQLLAALEDTRHFGDSKHPNRLELETQRALLRHAIRFRAEFRLNDDHWGRTSGVLLRLFESGDAMMQVGDATHAFRDLTKVEWSDVVGPLVGEGGFEYRTASSQTIFKTMTWVS
jgi:hypothetical protein